MSFPSCQCILPATILIPLYCTAMQARDDDVRILARALQSHAARLAGQVGIAFLAYLSRFINVERRADSHGNLSCSEHVPASQCLPCLRAAIGVFRGVKQDRDALHGDVVREKLVLEVFLVRHGYQATFMLRMIAASHFIWQ